MNQRPSLREALALADIADSHAEACGRAAVAEAIADPAAVVIPPDRALIEEERQRLLDAALGDSIEVVSRHRQRLGRRVCSLMDARTIREIHTLLRSMSDAGGGADGDPSFQ